MPPEERKAAVDQLVEQGELPRAKKKKRSAAQKPKQVAQTLVARLKVKGDEHALAVLEQMARLLGREVSEKSSDK
jgi:prolyl-tRNA editing enzyme YbaK/EbsC (Cys-tRNA(Pro) deacylase)